MTKLVSITKVPPKLIRVTKVAPKMISVKLARPTVTIETSWSTLEW